MTNAFDITNLNKSYANQVALDDVSLSVSKGSMNFLLGANGSGKSTLMKCMAGHQHWDSGDILLYGKSRKYDRKGFNMDMHLISEDIMPPQLSIGELKTLYQDIYQRWDENIFLQFMHWGNLNLKQTLASVSRGQKIQGLLALTLATGPEILLIDEATAVLDPFIRNRFMIEIDRLNKMSSMTVVIATNIGSEVATLVGRLLIMQKGQVVIDREAAKIAEGFIKIRISPSNIDNAVAAGFSFIEQNQDKSFSFLGMENNLPNLKVDYSSDKRAISVDEIFIFFSDRKLM